jgi:hypothetical protein
MSGENGRATPPAEGASPAADTKQDATKKASVDAQKEEVPAVVVETKPAAESEAGTKPAPATAAAPTGESDKPAEGKKHVSHPNCMITRAPETQFILLTLVSLVYSLRRETRRASRREARRRDDRQRRAS